MSSLGDPETGHDVANVRKAGVSRAAEADEFRATEEISTPQPTLCCPTHPLGTIHGRRIPGVVTPLINAPVHVERTERVRPQPADGG